MKIAIPSHKRLNSFKTRTYALLMRHGFDENDIYIFVSPESYEEYKDEFKNVILSKNNILDTRNHIIEYFDEGERVVEMDDDILSIKTTIKNTKPVEVDNLKFIFEESFEKCQGGLWGFNSVVTGNNFKCKVNPIDNIKIQRITIVNSCLGYFNRKDIKLSVKEKEDYERVILFYIKGIPILKREMYGIHTRYWTYAGGIQARYNTEERIKVQSEAAEYLFNLYPEHVYKCIRKTKWKEGMVDLRFRK